MNRKWKESNGRGRRKKREKKEIKVRVTERVITVKYIAVKRCGISEVEKCCDKLIIFILCTYTPREQRSKLYKDVPTILSYSDARTIRCHIKHERYFERNTQMWHDKKFSDNKHRNDQLKTNRQIAKNQQYELYTLQYGSNQYRFMQIGELDNLFWNVYHIYSLIWQLIFAQLSTTRYRSFDGNYPYDATHQNKIGDLNQRSATASHYDDLLSYVQNDNYLSQITARFFIPQYTEVRG